MELTFAHLAGAMAIIAIMVGIGVFSGRKVKSAADFEQGGNSMSSVLVGGSIAGTLVGGSSTIGTAQLAFEFGLSAWWFTLGAGLGCLLLGLVMAQPVRSYGSGSVQQIVRREFGNGTGLVTCIAVALSCLFNVTSQMLAANALIGTVTGLTAPACAAIAIVLMAVYVGFGGIRGTGILGVVKLALLYALVAVTGLLALSLGGGLGQFYTQLPHEQYFNLLARGPGKDLGAGASVVFGVMSSQVYIQAVMSAKSHGAAKKGAFLGACLIPPIGLGGVFVGYYMRLRFPDMAANQVLPRFIMEQLPPAVAGACLGILLFVLVGTGAGMSLSFSSVVVTDIYKDFAGGRAEGKKLLVLQRAALLALLLASGLMAMANLGSAILSWGTISMGLRAVVLLLPLLAALFLPGKVPHTFMLLSSAIGMSVMLWGIAANWPWDPLIPGVAAGAVISGLGILQNHRKGRVHKGQG